MIHMAQNNDIPVQRACLFYDNANDNTAVCMLRIRTAFLCDFTDLAKILLVTHFCP